MPRDKKPYFRWYPGDLRRDTALQSCPWDVRAVWREMLDFMHDGEPRGHLTAGGVPIKDGKSLAIAIGGAIPVKVCQRALDMLGERQVFSRTDAGVIFSRRMVRDEATDEARAEGGGKGGRKVTPEGGVMVPPSPAFPPDPPITPAPGTGTGRGHARASRTPGPLAGMLPRDHLGCRPPCVRVCVSERLHAVLVERLGGDRDAGGATLDAFYAEVRTQLGDDTPVTDPSAWKFWERVFAERFGHAADRRRSPRSPSHTPADVEKYAGLTHGLDHADDAR